MYRCGVEVEPSSLPAEFSFVGSQIVTGEIEAAPIWCGCSPSIEFTRYGKAMLKGW